MSGLARLLWIYLNRCSESATSTRKRLDGVLRILFFANGPLWPPDLPFDAFVLILHFAITRQLDQGEDLLSEFLNGVDIASTTDSAILDRLTALVRALILSLTAVADDRQAKWPPSADLSIVSLDGYEAAGDLLAEDALTRQGVPELLTKTDRLWQGCCSLATAAWQSTAVQRCCQYLNAHVKPFHRQHRDGLQEAWATYRSCILHGTVPHCACSLPCSTRCLGATVRS